MATTAETTSGNIVNNSTIYQRLYSQQQHKLTAVYMPTTAQTTSDYTPTTGKYSSGLHANNSTN